MGAMKRAKGFFEFLKESAPLLESNRIAVGKFVRYRRDKDFTGGLVVAIHGKRAEIKNWDGSIQELAIKDLELVDSWN